MKARQIALFFLMMTIIMGTGCQESQTPEYALKLERLEQTQLNLAAKIDKKLSEQQLVIAKLDKIEKTIELIDERLTQNTERLEKVAHLPETLLTDMDMNKIYLKSVRDDMGMIRTQIAKVIRIHNDQIAEGRMVYTQLMEKEIEVLSDRLAKMQKTVEEMHTLGPAVHAELAQAVALISGNEDPNRLVATTE
jgi:hypothetical protein